jgi:hypothetical protein
MMNELVQLQKWYFSQCNGDWEHQYGISIVTLDNPGWSVQIDLAETNFESKAFKPIEIGVGAESVQDSPDWVSCKVERQQFVGHCGPLHLMTVLGMFLDWKDKSAG